MLSLMLATVIMSKAAQGGEVRLHDTVGECQEGYYAELVVDVPDLVTDAKTVETGCWFATDNDPRFTVVWDKSGKMVRYDKEGTIRVESMEFDAKSVVRDFEESKPVSP